MNGRLIRILVLCMVFAFGSLSKAADEVIDLLVVYTTQTGSWQGGEDGVESLAQAAVLSSNQAFEASGVALRLNLVGLRHLNFIESETDMGDDLDHLSESKQVSDWRNELGADAVTLFRKGSVDGVAGLAWILGDENGKESTAFSVVSINSVLSGLLLQHEVGHNLGAAHDRENSESGGLFPFSYGFRFQGQNSSNRFGTLMSYADWGETKINQFSNPDISYDGTPTGIAAGGKAADNARTLGSTGGIVAEYRGHIHKFPNADAGDDLRVEDEDGDGFARAHLDGSGSYSEEGRGTWTWSWSGGETKGKQVDIDFPPGEWTVTLTVLDEEGHASVDQMIVTADEWQPIESVFARNYHSFYIKENGLVFGFGLNNSGSLGLGNEYEIGIPREVPISDVASIAIGESHTLFLRRNGSVYATGLNDFGQLGNGSIDGSDKPIEVFPSGVIDIAASDYSSFFLKADGSLWAAGDGAEGIFEYDASNEAREPIRLIESGVVRVAAGREFILARMEDGSLLGAGRILHSVFGDEEVDDPREIHRIFDGGVASMATGLEHSVILMENGSVWTFGSSNWMGQLGVGDNNRSNTPSRIVESGAVEVSAGDFATYIFMKDGSLWKAGSDLESQFQGEWDASFLVPTKLYNDRAISAVGSAEGSLILRSDRSLWGIGNNRWSHLGVGGQAAEVPTVVVESNAGGPNVPPVANAGDNIDGADAFGIGESTVQLDGRLSFDDWTIKSYSWSWDGGVANGRIVDDVVFPVGETVVTLTVVDDAGIENQDTCIVSIREYARSVAVAASSNRYFVLKEDGSLFCFGNGTRGELGLGEGVNYVRRPTFALKDVRSVFAGYNYTLVVRNDGSLWAAAGSYLEKILGVFASEQEGGFYRIVEKDVVSASAGDVHFLFLKTDGSVWGLGSNSFGALDNGDSENRAQPVRLVESGAQGILAAVRGSYIVMEDGSLWGLGNIGKAEPVQGLERILESEVVSVFESKVRALYAVKTDGSIWGMGLVNPVSYGFAFALEWGVFSRIVESSAVEGFFTDSDMFGYRTTTGAVLGYNTEPYRSGGYEWFKSKLDPFFYGDIVSVAFGNGMGLCIRRDGSLWMVTSDRNSTPFLSHSSWVKGFPFQLMPPVETLEVFAPTANAGADIQVIDATGDGKQLVALDGSLSSDDWFVADWEWTWADGELHGQIVNGEFPLGRTSVKLKVTDLEGMVSEDWVEVEVKPSQPITSIYSALDKMALVLENGALYERSNGSSEQFGSIAGGLGLMQVFPSGVRAYSASQSHTLVTMRDGSLWTYGKNDFGQLGIGDRRAKSVPVEVISDGVVKAVAASYHSFALKRDGSLWACGRKSFGEFGLGTLDSTNRFVEVVSSDVVDIASSDRVSLFVKRDGSLWLMGYGIFDTTVAGASASIYLTPIKILDSGVVNVCVSGRSCFVIMEDGSLWAAGLNHVGQLGLSLGTSRYYNTLQLVESRDVLKVESQGHYAVYTKSDGSLWSMGQNDRFSPYGVGNLSETFYGTREMVHSGVVGFSLGPDNLLVQLIDGSIWGAGLANYIRIQEDGEYSYPHLTRLLEGSPDWIGQDPVAVVGGQSAFYSDSDSITSTLYGQNSWDDLWIVSWSWKVNGIDYEGPEIEAILKKGNNTVELTVTDADGNQASDSRVISLESIEAFGEWLAGFFDEATIEQMDNLLEADPDGDGLSNEAERLLGLDPSSYRERLFLRQEKWDGGVDLFVDNVKEDAEIQVSISRDLANWDFLNVGSQRVDTNTIMFRTNLNDTHFLRLEID